MTNHNQLEVLTHVTHGHTDKVITHNGRRAGKTTQAEVSQLIGASETVLECIQNGAMFASDEASISACAEATDMLEASITTLKAKGF